MSDDTVNIEDCSVGDTLWFVDYAESDNDVVVLDASDGYIYSGEIAEIEMTSFQKGWTNHPDLKQYKVMIRGMDNSWGFTFRVGDDGSYNPRCYLSREEAEASIRTWYESSLKDAEEELAKMQATVEHLRQRKDAPILITTAEIIDKVQYRKYMSSILEGIHKIETERLLADRLKDSVRPRPQDERGWTPD